ncbi:hypothetical protein P0082_03485 [Candidatus Haliotispira prima]|uniref:Transglutaminase-like domain-containing protein n=1 Tax=Candidatus Haliotispira prima TaxID=3034016 RepID=A0ABY8MIY7_9SPIO|nr:hypothetical protein P0082_03485 [Candidatus Haliotispira prima]
MQIAILKKKLWSGIVLLLLAASSLFYFCCFGVSQEFRVDSYQEHDEGDRVVLSINGTHFGQLSETEIYINNRKISRGQLLKWSSNEIRIFIRKPFTYALIQLKKGNRFSRYIPVWNEAYLPQVQHNPQIQGFPVLENYRMFSTRPPILDIQGQNLGLRYQGQLLLFSRVPNRALSIYFDPAKLQNYRILKPSEVLFWSEQRIRVRLPQEAVEGHVFLLRPANEKLQNSNSLYVRAAPNRYFQHRVDSAADSVVRLVLDYPANIIPGPELSNSPAQSDIADMEMRNAMAQRFGRDLSEFSPVLLRWPRNELNQRWHNSEFPERGGERDKTGSRPALVLPARTLGLKSLAKDFIREYRLPAGSRLLQARTQSIPRHLLYLDVSYSYWKQEPPAASRGQNYSDGELGQLDYLFRRNHALTMRYKVPHWRFGNSLDNVRLSPYWKALELYKQAVRELRIPARYLPDLPGGTGTSLLWQYSPADSEAETGKQLAQWPQQYLDAQGYFATGRGTGRGTGKGTGTKELAPEHILLLLLRAMTELDIPARIVAGSIFRIPNVGRTRPGENEPGENEPERYYWMEIYLPGFGWFQADLLAEILSYQKDPSAFNTSKVPNYWGQLNVGPRLSPVRTPGSDIGPNVGPAAELSTGLSTGSGVRLQPAQIKLAFFALGEFWQSFDSGFYRQDEKQDERKDKRSSDSDIADENEAQDEVKDEVKNQAKRSSAFSWRLHLVL